VEEEVIPGSSGVDVGDGGVFGAWVSEGHDVRLEAIEDEMLSDVCGDDLMGKIVALDLRGDGVEFEGLREVDSGLVKTDVEEPRSREEGGDSEGGREKWEHFDVLVKGCEGVSQI